METQETKVLVLTTIAFSIFVAVLGYVGLIVGFIAAMAVIYLTRSEEAPQVSESDRTAPIGPLAHASSATAWKQHAATMGHRHAHRTSLASGHHVIASHRHIPARRPH